MKVYGIKSCSTVAKAIKFLKENNIDFDFFDYKKESVGEDKVNEWLKSVELDIIFNKKGQKYRQLGLKDLNLDDSGKIKWLAKDNLLFKRPIIEYGDGKVLVGFNEEDYSNTFLK